VGGLFRGSPGPSRDRRRCGLAASRGRARPHGGSALDGHPVDERRSHYYRYSPNPQIAIDADTRLVIAIGDPYPGNRNDCTARDG
jgi:hypothetical protein